MILYRGPPGGARIFKEHCPRCGGNEYLEDDFYTLLRHCLLCGRERNLDGSPFTPLPLVSPKQATRHHRYPMHRRRHNDWLR